MKTSAAKTKQSEGEAGLLRRPRSPSEHVLVQVMRRQGKTPDEIERILRRLAPPPSDQGTLRNVR
jgi:hypothetical protein